MDAICSLFGVDAASVDTWSNEFTGWHPGTLDESDGTVDDPPVVCALLANDITLRIEFHPGSWYWLLGNARTSSWEIIGILGPHWSQPGLRWHEAAAMANVARVEGTAPMPLLLPLVWLTQDDDVHAARDAVFAGWSSVSPADEATALRLAELWSQAVAGGQRFRWWQKQSVGWVTDSENSSRFEGRPIADLRKLNRLVSDAIAG